MRAPVAFVDSDAPRDHVPSLPVLMSGTLTDLIESIVGVERMLASLSGVRAELIDQARQWSEVSALGDSGATSRIAGWDAAITARREFVTELACALRLPERTTETLIATSRALMHELPATRNALRSGEVSYRHAQVLVDHATFVPESGRAAFEAAALPPAKRLTVSKFDRKARIVREQTHPETIATRHEASVADRAVDFQPARDGMAWLSAYLPAPEALGIYNRVTDIAMSLQGSGESRTLTQLRADAFAGLMTESSSLLPAAHAIRARVLVTVPVLTLMGVSEEPASLEGYGPIDAETARRLAAKAPSFTRILTHPETGAVLSVGRTRYSVPEDLKTWLRVRDETCRFPGCHRSARQSDLDHTVDWQFGGETRHDNLAHLCRSHHNVKHHTSWTVKNQPNGVLEWTSPAGRSYATEPATRIRPGPA
jgi:Domain of unknown function (DUF222)